MGPCQALWAWLRVSPSVDKPQMGPLSSFSRWGSAPGGRGTRLSWELPGTETGSPPGRGGEAWVGVRPGQAPLRPASRTQAGTVAQAAGVKPRTCKCPQAPPPPPMEEGPREPLVELPGSFRELFTFFCANTTVHGTIRLICSSQNRLKTASWGLLFLGALGALYWQFGLLFEQYWRYPVIMTVSMHSEGKLFPSVTLCDMNPHR